MWDRLKIRERDRLLGVLFVGVLVAVLGGCLLALGFPLAGEAVGVTILGIFWLAMMRRMLALRQGNYGPAPVGPLSPDEKAKARAKLLGARGRSSYLR